MALYYRLYFEFLGRKIAEYNIQPKNMYNMDEKGFFIGYLKKAQRIFCRNTYDFKKINNSNQNSNREWITIIGTICANGTSLFLGLIYQGVSGNLQNS